MSNEITANQSAEYAAAKEALVKEAIQAAQNKVVNATVKHTMTGKIASRESEQLIDALFTYIKLLEDIAFGAGEGEGILN